MPQLTDNPQYWRELGVFHPEAFPLYYRDRQPFLLDGQASGAANAEANLRVTFNTNPHIFYGIRIQNVYETPPNADDFEPIQRIGLMGYDADQTVRVEFAQQNITADQIAMGTLQGRFGLHWHPFPTPYYLRGANECRIILRRLTSYPILTSDGEDFNVLPQVHVTLVTASLRDDMRVAAAPGSTGRP